MAIHLIGIARVSTDQQAADYKAGLPRQRQSIQSVSTANKANLIQIVEIIGGVRVKCCR